MRLELKIQFLPQVVHRSSSLSVEDSTVSPDTDKLDGLIKFEFDLSPESCDDMLACLLC